MPEHYYAASAFAWAVAATRIEAVKKVLGEHHIRDIERGVYITTCRVPLPISAKYDIRGFMPAVDTGADDMESYRIDSMDESEWKLVDKWTNVT